jgi:hypothetical protein
VTIKTWVRVDHKPSVLYDNHGKPSMTPWYSALWCQTQSSLYTNHKTRVSQSQAKRNHGDSANMDTQLRHSVTKGCHSITNYVGSKRFFCIFITRIFVFSKRFLSEFENAAIMTRQSHCRCSGIVRLIRSKACAGEYEYSWWLFLCAFTRLRKAIISFVMSVCSSIHNEQLASH